MSEPHLTTVKHDIIGSDGGCNAMLSQEATAKHWTGGEDQVVIPVGEGEVVAIRALASTGEFDGCDAVDTTTARASKLALIGVFGWLKVA